MQCEKHEDCERDACCDTELAALKAEIERLRAIFAAAKRHVNTIKRHVSTITPGLAGVTEMELRPETLVDGVVAANKYRARFSPPSVDEIAAYCKDRKNGIDAHGFLDYYQARGWKFKTGQSMKDWKAAVRTWERNNKIQPESSDADARLSAALDRIEQEDD